MNQTVRHALIVTVVVIAVAIALFMPTNKKIPLLTFTDIDGQTHQLSDYHGQPLLVVFWATDCPGCIQEMPELISLYDEYKNTAFKIVSVAMPHDTPAHIKAMRSSKQIPYLITWDETGEISKAFDNVRVTPTHFLISPEGKIVMRKIGTMNLAVLKQKLAVMGIAANNS
jgi:peroxiredoxin